MTENEELQGQQDEEIQMPDTKYKPGCNKLDSFNWLKDTPESPDENDIVEIRFKNTRKGFYRNINNLRFEIGDLVAVEASPGHDIGRISMIGRLVHEQLKELKTIPSLEDMKKVYRKAKDVDIQKWREAKLLEIPTMLRSRQIAEELKLGMKIGDVEYQGDKTKAIFYYIADERVDFRQLIKVLAEEFKVRIEMRQIGARQEAGRIGGIGSCGRELCCATYITNFTSVTTTHAKYQELSLNPQKLAGQCGKLKCCLNYEVDTYLDVRKNMPSQDIKLETQEGRAYHQKTDIFKGIMWYSFSPDLANNMVPVKVDRVIQIIELNKKGIIVEQLNEAEPELIEKEVGYYNPVGQESLTRFDNKGKGNKGSSSKKKALKGNRNN